MGKNIIAIDPGTNCGWAIASSDGKTIESGVWNLASQRMQGAGMRYVMFRQHLKDIVLYATNVDYIVFEEVRRHAGTTAAHVYGGLVATLMAFCEESGIPYRSIPVQTIKKNATGKGNASKDDMVAAAKKRWKGFVPLDDNEADARFIALAAINT